MNWQIVVPLAGEGKRFLDAGYSIPKPLLPVSGLPMVVRAVMDLPVAKRIVFLVRAEYMRGRYAIDRILREYFPSCIVIPVEKTTAGQACTVRLAADSLEPNEPIIVAACDNTHLYNEAEHARLLEETNAEALVWVYTGESSVTVNPEQYGWVREHDGIIEHVSCKAPISENPRKDPVVSGFFTFRTAERMVTAIDAMVGADMRINQEFYMDVVPNILLANGHVVRAFFVEKYIGWGTPADYEDYLLRERYYDQIHQ